MFKGAVVSKTTTHTLVTYDSIDPNSEIERLLLFDIEILDYLYLLDTDDLIEELRKRLK